MDDRVRRAIGWAVTPLRTGLTYRRYVHLLLGAVLLLPYLALGWLFATSVTTGGLDPIAFVLLLVLATPAAIGVALVPGVRTLELTAARALLGITIPEPDHATIDAWPARLRAAGWLAVNCVAGGLVALLTLIAVPFSLGFLIAPFQELPPFPTGWAAAWLVLAGLLIPVALLHVVSASGAGLAWLAPRMIGPTRTETLAAELDAARRSERTLAERNRLARELHDSVGHALTVTTLQAGAAARVLESDPAFVARALEAIAEAGRTALAELDHVLGLLRDGEPGEASRAPQPDLADLDALLTGTRSAGVEVDAELVGTTETVPSAVSREAYRIVQEGLTNALRHAGPVPVAVRVQVAADAVELELTNPLGDHPAGRGGGRGLAGMRERVGMLRGDLTAGPDAGVWRVRARLPLAP
ncbi:histidine kinase [Actinomycetes bacterium KLBMP 9759]